MTIDKQTVEKLLAGITPGEWVRKSDTVQSIRSVSTPDARGVISWVEVKDHTAICLLVEKENAAFIAASPAMAQAFLDKCAELEELKRANNELNRIIDQLSKRYYAVKDMVDNAREALKEQTS